MCLNHFMKTCYLKFSVLTNSKELMLDGVSGNEKTGHFKCSIDSKYIGEIVR